MVIKKINYCRDLINYVVVLGNVNLEGKVGHTDADKNIRSLEKNLVYTFLL